MSLFCRRLFVNIWCRTYGCNTDDEVSSIGHYAAVKELMVGLALSVITYVGSDHRNVAEAFSKLEIMKLFYLL